MKAEEITPQNARCAVGPCPAIFETDERTYLVVGKIVARNNLPSNVLDKIGFGETVVEIPKKILPT